MLLLSRALASRRGAGPPGCRVGESPAAGPCPCWPRCVAAGLASSRGLGVRAPGSRLRVWPLPTPLGLLAPHPNSAAQVGPRVERAFTAPTRRWEDGVARAPGRGCSRGRREFEMSLESPPQRDASLLTSGPRCQPLRESFPENLAHSQHHLVNYITHPKNKTCFSASLDLECEAGFLSGSLLGIFSICLAHSRCFINSTVNYTNPC